MFKTEEGLMFLSTTPPKAKRVINRCSDSVILHRKPSGEYVICGVSKPVKNKDGNEDFKLVKLSVENYTSKDEASRRMLDGTYKLNPDYKSFFETELNEWMSLTDYCVTTNYGNEGGFFIACAEQTYDDDVNRQQILSIHRVSEETFKTEGEAIKALENGDWTLIFKFNIHPCYNITNKLRVMKDKEGKYFLGRHRVYEEENTGQAMLDYHECIRTNALTLEDAQKILTDYLEGI